MTQLKGLYILDASSLDLIYGSSERERIAQLVHIFAPPQTSSSIIENPGMLADADVLLTGWGAPRLDEQFLALAPNLKAVFYGAGSLASVLTPTVWDRQIVVTTAIEANAIPVAEYALSTILFSLKHGWRLMRQTREHRDFPDRNAAPGCYGTTVGLISMGVIARALRKRLAPFSLNIIAYDPFLSASEAAELGVTLVSLSELFERSDVASLHTPHLEETEGLITRENLASMKPGATFINTARAEVVCQHELIEVAQQRPDLQFVLDVASPEPPEPDSLLYSLPNVVLTPHMAGSVGLECQRMGQYMAEELARFVSGKPLRWAVTREMARHSSHRPALQLKLPSRTRRSKVASQ